MKLFYRLLLWMAEFELAMALAAPMRNPERIQQLEDDVNRWELALSKEEMK